MTSTSDGTDLVFLSTPDPQMQKNMMAFSQDYYGSETLASTNDWSHSPLVPGFARRLLHTHRAKKMHPPGNEIQLLDAIAT